MSGPLITPTLSLTDFRRAQFLTSASKVSECPDDIGFEVAFAGRSNAGKSSCINVLTDNRHLARTSKTPGRTQLINFFSLNLDNTQRLVDLPGYGYAKVSHSTKENWQLHLENYLQKRKSLRGLVLLMDCRHPLKDFDCNLIAWAQTSDLPVHAVLTKSDKFNRAPGQQILMQVRNELRKEWGNGVSVQLFSSLSKQGVEELANKMASWLSPAAAEPVTE